MTSSAKLLPLPETNGSYTNPYDSDDLTNYALANVEHHTAAKDAEIEALRAERNEKRREWGKRNGRRWLAGFISLRAHRRFRLLLRLR